MVYSEILPVLISPKNSLFIYAWQLRHLQNRGAMPAVFLPLLMLIIV